LKNLLDKDKANSLVAVGIKERSIHENERDESNSFNVDQEGEQEDDREPTGYSNHKEQDSKATSKVIYRRNHVSSTMSKDFQTHKSGMDSVASTI